jgi:hypothetical protein
MRVILAVLCLFYGSPGDIAAEYYESTSEPKVERYRALLAEISSSGAASEHRTLIDLPEDLREAIEAWTKN